MVTNQENKFFLSLYQYIKLMYKIWGQSEVKQRSYCEILIKTAISGPKLKHKKKKEMSFINSENVYSAL